MAAAAPSPAGRIGPNAVLQLDAAIGAADGAAMRRRVFGRAGLLRHLETPPAAMVAETELARLYQALREELGEDAACRRAEAAGAGTARYLLAHRIPPLLRRLLPHAPPPLAAAVLTWAIRRHGWTFLGSGALSVAGGRPLGIRIRLAESLAPVAPMAAAFYRATFEGLYRALVSPRIRARPRPEGAGGCGFELEW